jgi:hypothetical protein
MYKWIKDTFRKYFSIDLSKVVEEMELRAAESDTIGHEMKSIISKAYPDPTEREEFIQKNSEKLRGIKEEYQNLLIEKIHSLR